MSDTNLGKYIIILFTVQYAVCNLSASQVVRVTFLRAFLGQLFDSVLFNSLGSVKIHVKNSVK